MDIGASDGVSFSNTLFFEREMRWSGVAVEPLPGAFEMLRANRRCRTVQGCVSRLDGEVKFLAIEGYSEMLSGIVGHHDPRHLARIEREQSEHGGLSEKIRVPSMTFGTLMERESIDHIDYLSIDTEGSEFEVLSGIDFCRVAIEVISVENNYHDRRFRIFLRAKGYELIALVGDEIYRRTPRRER